MAVKSDKVITNCLLDILEISLLATGEKNIGAPKMQNVFSDLSQY
jgi:hypothetical protein